MLVDVNVFVKVETGVVVYDAFAHSAPQPVDSMMREVYIAMELLYEQSLTVVETFRIGEKLVENGDGGPEAQLPQTRYNE